MVKKRPLIMKKRVLSAIVAATIMLTTFTITPITVQAEPENEELKEARSEYEELQKKVNDFNDKIQKIDNDMTNIKNKIDTNKKQITSLNNEINKTNDEIEESKSKISEKEEILGKRLREVYKSGGETSLLSLLFSADSFSDLINKIDSASRISKMDQKVVQELTETKTKLDESVSSMQKKVDEIVGINEELDNQQSELKSKKDEQSELLSQAKAEQDEFDVKYLAKQEEELVKGYIDICNNSSSSLSEIENAISILKSLKDNQIKSPIIKDKIKVALENGEKLKAKAEEAKKQQETSVQLNRGGSDNTKTVDVHASGNRGDLVAYAQRFMGCKYVYGATGPNTFDCSGFTSYVYANAAGIGIGRTTYDQVKVGTPVSRDALQVGDLVFTSEHHVGIYVGGGCMIHAPQTGDVVKISSIWSFYAGRRILA